MSRIEETNAVVKKTIAVAPKIEIHWNSMTNAGSVSFWVAHEQYENDVFIGMKDDTRHQMRPLGVKLEDLLPRVFTVQTENGPVDVPVMLVMGTIMQAFDELYNEKLIALNPPEEPEEP